MTPSGTCGDAGDVLQQGAGLLLRQHRSLRLRERTHPDGGGVGALHSRSVEAGEERAVADRVSLGEDQGTRLSASQLRVQPPDLRTQRSVSLEQICTASRTRWAQLTAGPSVVVYRTVIWTSRPSWTVPAGRLMLREEP